MWLYWFGCNTSDWIKFISRKNQSLQCSRLMFWLHEPQILRHFTTLRPARKIWSFSQIVWVIRNFDTTSIFLWLGVLKYWIPSCIVCGIKNPESSALFGGSEIVNPLLMCYLEDQKLWILSCVLGGSEILIPLLCCLGDQKFWMLSCMCSCRGWDLVMNFRLWSLGIES